MGTPALAPLHRTTTVVAAAALALLGACTPSPEKKPDAGGAGKGGAGQGAAGRDGGVAGAAGGAAGHSDGSVADAPTVDDLVEGDDVPVTPPDGADAPQNGDAALDTGPAVGGLGSWSDVIDLRVVAVHSALLPGGRILLSDGQTTWGSEARVWTVATGEVDQVNAPSNIFCGAFEQMPNGRVLTVGGHLKDHYGNTDCNYFDPSANGDWTPIANMFFPRWYPSVITLGDGRFLAVGGETTCNECNVEIPEIYDATANKWTKLESAPFAFEYYPHLYLLPDGRVLVATTSRAAMVSQVLTLGASPSWSAVGGPAVDGGSSVMFRPGKILKAGTAVDPDKPARPTARTAYVLDMVGPGLANDIPDGGPYVDNGPDADQIISVPWPVDANDDAAAGGPYWRATGLMNHARAYHTLTVLPDGTVLVTGGGATTAPADVAGAVLEPELWDPETGMWKTLAPMTAHRLYHSEAQLLPDGRVAVLGGGRFGNEDLPTDVKSAQIFSPPYLGKGPRPTITSAPAKLTYGQAFDVQTPDASRIASVALLRFGAATHAYNSSQRYVPLTFSAGTAKLTVTAPVDANLAPGGNYMLFLVDTKGVPSVAAETRL